MKLKKMVSALVSIWKEPKEIVHFAVLSNIKLRVTPGAVRDKTDMDDAWFYLLAKNHQAIYDIGANIGYTALLAHVQDANKQYLLVDPNPKALQKAHFNLITNALGFRSQYYCAFVSNSSDQEITFYTIGSGAAGSMFKSNAESAGAFNSSIKVPTVTLDYLYNFYKWKPSFVKIDIEGAERYVMNGARVLAKETACIFLIELHETEGFTMEQMGDCMVDWCNENHYKCWYLKTKQIMTSGSLIRSRGKCHILLIPESEEFPEYLRSIEQGASIPKTS